MARILATPRLAIDRFALEDAAFILKLLSEPAFIEHIGDKGVRSLEDARRYLTDGPLASYAQHGFGLWRVALLGNGLPIGMVGIHKREALKDVDLGYAFLADHWGRGFAHEAAEAVMNHATEQLRIDRVVAIVTKSNEASIRVLHKIGFQLEGPVQLTAGEELQLFASAG